MNGRNTDSCLQSGNKEPLGKKAGQADSYNALN